MRTNTRNALGGTAVGLVVIGAIASMLGMRQPNNAPKIDPRIEAMQRQIRDTEDQLAATETQVQFWQQEMQAQDNEVMRLQAAVGPGSWIPFFLDRTKGLASRAANAHLDARLQRTLLFRKVQALRSDLAGW